MSDAKFTPGPWRWEDDYRRLLGSSDRDNEVLARSDAGDLYVPHWGVGYANARLLEAAPELFAEVESRYIELADIHNNWPGRHTSAGQSRLCDLRDLIAKVTGRTAEDVQDDYGARASAPGGAS